MKKTVKYLKKIEKNKKNNENDKKRKIKKNKNNKKGNEQNTSHKKRNLIPFYMGMFDSMLKEGESLFKNEIALDFSYQPKVVDYRKAEQEKIASSIKPLFSRRNGRNIILTGKPGIGKTVSMKHVLNELEEYEDEIHLVYVNCWQKNTSFKIAEACCHALDMMLTQNKRTDELLNMIIHKANKKSIVIVFDEIDKVEEYDFLYTLLEELYRKTIILITNFKEWIANLDDRVRSRLMPDIIEFLPYSAGAIRGILEYRKKYAFVDGVWEEDAFDMIIDKTVSLGDIRTGLNMMKEAGIEAENKSSRKITKDHVNKALEKLDSMFIKKKDDLEDETRFILEVIKNNSGKKMGDLFSAYQSEGGKQNYKSFTRKIKKLADNSFVSKETQMGGKDGTTTYVRYGREKKLTEYQN